MYFAQMVFAVAQHDYTVDTCRRRCVWVIDGQIAKHRKRRETGEGPREETESKVSDQTKTKTKTKSKVCLM